MGVLALGAEEAERAEEVSRRNREGGRDRRGRRTTEAQRHREPNFGKLCDSVSLWFVIISAPLRSLREISSAASACSAPPRPQMVRKPRVCGKFAP
jgi:hypothetical protein